MQARRGQGRVSVPLPLDKAALPRRHARLKILANEVPTGTLVLSGARIFSTSPVGNFDFNSTLLCSTTATMSPA